MNWGDLGDFESGSDLVGDLAASIVELTPNDRNIVRNAVELKTQRVHNFKATKQELEGKRGKGFRWTVQCDIIIADDTGMKKLEAFKQTIADGKSEMRVSYDKQPEQATIPETEATQEVLTQ